PCGQDAAQPEHDARTECRVAYHAGHELAAPAHLLGDQQLRVAVLGAAESQQLVGRRAHGPGISESETDEIALGLVDDGIRAELQHDGEAQLLGGARRCRAIGDEDFARDGDAVAGDEQLGVMLGERGSRRWAPGGVHAACDHGGFCGGPASATGLPPVAARGYASRRAAPGAARRGTRCRRQPGTEPYWPRATAARWSRETAT